MYKYAYELLQELSKQRPSSRNKPSRCFSNQDQKEITKVSLSPKDKRLKSFVLMKLNQIQAEKHFMLSKKRKAILWYKMILDKMVTPLIPYMPSVTTSDHLSKLTDFRTFGGLSERSEETNKKKIIVRPKCVEEPLPILIKPEYKVLKSHKKGWKILNRLAKARDSKNEMINKYKIWKNKFVKETENQKKLGKNKGLLAYNLFLKDAIESKIEDLMPGIKTKNEHTNVYDFRLQNEQQVEQCENHLKAYEELVTTPTKKAPVSTNLGTKGPNRNKTVIPPKPLHTKTNKKTGLITVKTKQNETPKLKKDENVKVLRVKPAIYLKEENRVKPANVQGPPHKQVSSVSDNRMKSMKPKIESDKSIRKLSAPKIKNLAVPVIQTINITDNKMNLENQSTNNILSEKKNIEEKEDKKEICNSDFTALNNFSDVVHEKCNEFGLFQDEMTKSSNNILNEPKIPSNITEVSDKHLETKTEGNRENDLLSTYNTNRPNMESAIISPLEYSNSHYDFKSDRPITLHNSNKISKDSATSQDDVKFSQITNIYKSENQSGISNEISKITTENVNHNCKDSSLSELPDNPTFVNNPIVSLTGKTEEFTKETTDGNVLKNTYLVTFEVNDDEAFLKTRSQVVAKEIKGDLIDLNVVLEEEKKARDKLNSELLLENPKHSSGHVNLLSNTNKSESQIQMKKYFLKTDDRSKVYSKMNITSVINQDVSTEPVKKNLTEHDNVTYDNTNSDLYTNKVTKSLKENNTSDVNLNQNSNNINKTKTSKPNKKNITDDAGCKTKSEGIALGEVRVKTKKGLSKSHSLELVGQNKKEKVLKHKKVIREKGKKFLSNIPDKRNKNLKRSKELDKDKKYQEIINSVKKIIPSGGSNENLLGINSDKIGLTGTKIKSNVVKNYTKTIDELKEIINELPGNDNEQVGAAAKSKHAREMETKIDKTSDNHFKTAEVEKIVLESENLNKKLNKTEVNRPSKPRPKRISLKTIKVVEKIDTISKDLKVESGQKIVNKTNQTANKGKEDNKAHLELPKSNTSINKSVIDRNESGPQIEQITKENNSNLNPNTGRINPPKNQNMSTFSNKIAETPLKEDSMNRERTQKAKSVINIKLNERKAEMTKELIVNSDLKSGRSSKVKTNTSITGLTNKVVKPKNNSEGVTVVNSPKDQLLAKNNKLADGNRVDIHSFPNKSRVSRYLSKSAESKSSLIREEGSRENSTPIKAKSYLNVKEIETHKIAGQKSIKTTSLSLKSVVSEKDRSKTETGSALRRIAGVVSVENREQSSKDQTHILQRENHRSTPSPSKVDVNKTDANENEKLKFAMEKIVKGAQNSIGNQRKIIKFTRETALKKTIRSKQILPKTEQKEIPLVNTKRGNLSGVRTMDTQAHESNGLGLTKTLPGSNMFKDENKITSSQMEKKVSQPTGMLQRKTLKVVSNTKQNTNLQLPESTGDGNKLLQNTVRSRMQMKVVDRKNEEQFDVRKRLESINKH